MNHEDILQEPVYSPLVLEFLAVAHTYCLFAEEAHSKTAAEITDYMLKSLPLLYLRGSLLPEPEDEDFPMNEKYVTEEHWQTIFNDLREKFADKDEYWYVEDDNPHNDLVKGSLAESLADIYQDMKDFVILYQKPMRDAKAAAVWEIRQLFFSHWGFRIVNVLKVMHYRNFSDENSRAMDDPFEF